MERKTNKIISLMLCFVMLAGLMPTYVTTPKAHAESEEKVLYSCDFDSEDSVKDWTFYDYDGDGRNWIHKIKPCDDSDSGEYVLASYTYDYHPGNLIPNNYAYMPEFTLPAESKITLSYTVYARDTDNYAEHYSVGVYTKEDGFTVLREETLKMGEDRFHPSKRTLDLSKWAGQTVEIYFRHHNSVNVSCICIDDILVKSRELSYEEVEALSFYQLKDLMDNAPTNGVVRTIKLGCDISVTQDTDGFELKLTDENQNVELDLNGKKLYRKSKSNTDQFMITLEKGTLTLTDSSKGAGELYADITYTGKTSYTVVPCAIRNRGGTLIIEEGQYRSDGSLISAVTVDGGDTVINGGIFNGKQYAFVANGYGQEGTTITINGGEFHGTKYGIFMGGNLFEQNNSTYKASINNAVSYSPVFFATFESTVPSHITPNTVVTAYDKNGNVKETYEYGMKYDQDYISNEIMLSGYKIEFKTKPAITQIPIEIPVPRPDALVASLEEISYSDSKGYTVKDIQWFNESNTYLFAGAKFKENVSYKIELYIEADEGEWFSKNLSATVNGQKAEASVSYESCTEGAIVYTFPPTEAIKLTGKVQFTSSANPGQPIAFIVKDLPKELDESKLSYKWQERVGFRWMDISGDNAQIKNFVPSADMLNKEIRVYIYAEGCTGAIVSNAITVSKLSNPAVPKEPTLLVTGSDFTTLHVYTTPGQEYVYRDSNVSDTSTINWNEGKIDLETGDVTGLNLGSTYYVYTRITETETTQPSKAVKSNSIKMSDPQYLQKVTLEGYTSYGKGNTIFIPKGESITIKVNKEPSSAQKWSNFTFKSPASTDLFTVTSGSSAPSGDMPSEITLTAGSKTGYGSMGAYVNGNMSINYGTWSVIVYDNDNISSVAKAVSNTEYNDITLNIGDSYTPEKPSVTLAPSQANSLFTKLEWHVCGKVIDSVSFTPQYDATENPYIKVNKETGEVTALQSSESLEGNEKYYTYVAYFAVNESTGDRIQIDSYRVNINEAQEIPVESITIMPDSVTLAPGKDKTLIATVNPINTTVSDTVAWSKISGSDNISVDLLGKVTISQSAKDGETATIQAAYGGKTATCVVTVSIKKYEITVTDGTAYIDSDTIITEAQAGCVVTIKANKAPEGKVFNKWVVVNGFINSSSNPEFDAYSETTQLNMPSWDIEIKATYTYEKSFNTEDWYSDEENHWKLDEFGLIIDKAAHEFGDDGVCNICGYGKHGEAVYGDVNNDGKVNMEDVTSLQKIIAKLTTHESYGGNSELNSDCNHDGKVNMEDVVHIQKYLAKLIPEL